MSFSIPAISSVEVTAAVPKFAWKLYADAAYVEVTGFVNGVFKELFELTGGVKLLELYIKQVCNEADNRTLAPRIVLDGVTMTGDDAALVTNVEEGVLFYWKLVGSDLILMPIFDENLRASCMLSYEDFSNVYANAQLPEGHTLSCEIDVAAVGTSQKVYYRRKYWLLEEV